MLEEPLHLSPKEVNTASERRDKAARLRENESNSFPRSFPDRTEIASAPSASSDAVVRIAGRLVRRRRHKQVVFMDLRDSSGEIEVICTPEGLGEEEYARTPYLDAGDILGVEGCVATNAHGTPVLHARALSILGKALAPPPQIRSQPRRRLQELEMIAGGSYVELLRVRRALTRFLRRWFDENGFLEVDTPILLPSASGASSEPFTSHGNAIDADLYLRVEIEQSLKRLVIGGVEKVYELGRCFRNEGMSRRHHFEFTLLEWLQGYADYRDTMILIETVISAAAKELFGTCRFARNGKTFDLTPPWRRITVREAILKETGIDVLEAATAELVATLGEVGRPVASWAEAVALVYAKRVEANLHEPTFVIDFPGQLFPTAKRHPDDPETAESFEAIVAGVEISSGATNVNDPDEQRLRFTEQRLGDGNHDGSSELAGMNELFLRGLFYGMMPLSGAGLGIDRIVMLLTERKSIRDAIPFPTA